MSTLTATVLLNDAALDLGVNDAGGTLSATQLADGLRRINRMIDNWSVDPLMANAALVSSFATVSGTQSYNIGTGQTWNIARPTAITGAAIKMANGLTMPVEIVTVSKWTSLPDRDSSSNLVAYLFYDRGSPTVGIVRLSPIPLGGNMEIISWVALSQFADLTTPLTMTPGYERMLEAATAIEIAPMFPGCDTKRVEFIFSEAKAAVRQVNASILGLTPPGGLVSPASQPPAVAPKITAE